MEDEEFHLVDQCDQSIWNAFVAGLKPLYEQFICEEREGTKCDQETSAAATLA